LDNRQRQTDNLTAAGRFHLALDHCTVACETLPGQQPFDVVASATLTLGMKERLGFIGLLAWALDVEANVTAVPRYLLFSFDNYRPYHATWARTPHRPHHTQLTPAPTRLPPPQATLPRIAAFGRVDRLPALVWITFPFPPPWVPALGLNAVWIGSHAHVRCCVCRRGCTFAVTRSRRALPATLRLPTFPVWVAAAHTRLLRCTIRLIYWIACAPHRATRLAPSACWACGLAHLSAIRVGILRPVPTRLYPFSAWFAYAPRHLPLHSWRLASGKCCPYMVFCFVIRYSSSPSALHLNRQLTPSHAVPYPYPTFISVLDLLTTPLPTLPTHLSGRGYASSPIIPCLLHPFYNPVLYTMSIPSRCLPLLRLPFSPDTVHAGS